MKTWSLNKLYISNFSTDFEHISTFSASVKNIQGLLKSTQGCLCSAVYVVNLFMHNVEKWPNML